MGTSRSDLFTPHQNDLANAARVLANPARIAIVEYLLEANSCINGTLVQELGLAQSTVSQHLKELKNFGLIKGSIEGASMCYCIDPKRWNEISELFSGLFIELKSEEETNCC